MGEACLLSVSMSSNLCGLFVGKLSVLVSVRLFFSVGSGTPEKSLDLTMRIKVWLLVFWEPEPSGGRVWESAFSMRCTHGHLLPLLS